MSELFANSGQVENNYSLNTPQLDGDFLSSIDNALYSEGLGLVIPLGGGGTARRYSDYGVSPVDVPTTNIQSAEAYNLATGGSNLTYNITGLVGPQGEKGDKGDPGEIQIFTIGGNFLTDLGTTLSDIKSSWVTQDTLMYSSDLFIYWNLTWEGMDIDAAVSSWNEIDLDTDGSAGFIASDDGIYVSSDSGDTWAKKTPGGENFISASCTTDGAKAVIGGNMVKDLGRFWATSDYGTNWSVITITP